MDQYDSRGNTELCELLEAQKSKNTIPSSSSSLQSLAVRGHNTQNSTPMQLIDQRRHTVDFSAWSSPGKTLDQIQALTNSSFVNGLSWNDNQTPQEVPGYNIPPKDPRLIDSSNKHLAPSFRVSQEIQSTDEENEKNMTQLFSNNNTMNKQCTNGYAIAAADMFGRRASLSQLATPTWDQPEQLSFHKHSASLEMGPLDSINISNAVSSLYSYPSAQIGIAPEGMNDQRLQLSAARSMSANQDSTRFFASEQPSQYISSRRNSRILPNPIQPPTASHAKKASFDEQSTRQHDQGPIRHGGFVPGFDIWSNQGDRQQLDANGGVRLDIQSQRRKSESVLHDLSGFSFTNFSSNYSNPPLSAVSTSSTRSASPMDNTSVYQQPVPNFFGEGRPELLDQLHPLSPLEPDSDYVQNYNATQTGLHPHFANALNPPVNGRLGSNSSIHDLCGLCSVQRSTISMGNCGHRICNKCHQHEKHRSVRLFQSEIPPCPFCTHGVRPAENFSSAQNGANTLRHQHQYPVPQISHPSYANQPHQQRQAAQIQSSQSSGSYNGGAEEIGDGYPQNRQYHYTFPSYNAPPAVMRLRSSSTQLETPSNANLSGNVTGTTNPNTGTGAGHYGHIAQASIQSSHHRPNIHPTATGSSSQRHIFHSQHPSGFSRHIPSFQPAGTMLLNNATQDHHNYPAMGRPGMTGPPTGAWCENGPTSIGPDFGPQDLQYAQQNYPPQIPQSQQRRGSRHQIFQPATSSNIESYQGYGNPGNIISSTSPLSFPILPNLPPAVPPKTPRTEAIQWAVVRVINIPWDLSLQDMHSFFSGFPYPPEHLLSQNVHILMDRATGKTFNTAFIELALTPHQAGIVASSRNLKILKGRLVTVELSSQDELLRAVFSKWTGQFLHGEPIIPGEPRQTIIGATISEERCDSDTTGTQSEANSIVTHNNALIGGITSTTTASNTPPFVTREEINTLLAVCRNYKLHFSRKCAERPFENILSILAKYPWHQSHRVLPLHRDHIFELLKLSIESLRTHLSKGHGTIHRTLLTRMVRTTILTPAFTGKQKAMVLHVSGCACPEDIIGWMSPPVPAETEIEDETQKKVSDDIEHSDSGIDSQIESLTISSEPSAQDPIRLSELIDEESSLDFQSIPPMPSYASAVTKRAVNPSSNTQSSKTSNPDAVTTKDTSDIIGTGSLATTTIIENLQSTNQSLDKSFVVSETITRSECLSDAFPQSESQNELSELVVASSIISLQTTSMEVVHTEASPLNPSSPTDTEFPDPELTTSERSKSESILDAIKIITQSTPRLSKPGTLNQLSNSISGTTISSVAAVATVSQANRQQRCEGGETL
ncbi:hypothetical protein BGZ76_001009 [Entomortierella beljakovae]|nr:hypothetical protein BGZ76_001009 [Entomortierella beljakovae]